MQCDEPASIEYIVQLLQGQYSSTLALINIILSVLDYNLRKVVLA